MSKKPISILRHRTVTQEMYHQKICFVATNNLESAKKFIDADWWDEKLLHAHTLNWIIKDSETDWKCIYIVIGINNKIEPVTINTLVHECFHASNMLYENKGISPDISNDEPQAYLIGWIFDRAYKYFKQWL